MPSLHREQGIVLSDYVAIYNAALVDTLLAEWSEQGVYSEKVLLAIGKPAKVTR